MRKNSKLLAIIAAGIFTSGCANFQKSENRIVLREGDTIGNYQVKIIHYQPDCEDPWQFAISCKGENYRYADMKKDGTGLLKISGTNYNVRVSTSGEVSLSPVEKK